MSGVSDVPATGVDDEKSQKTPKGRKLVQARLPFSAVDNKTIVPKVNETNKPKVSTETNQKVVKVSSVENDTNLKEVIEIDDSSKSHSLAEDSDQSNSIPDASLADEDQDSELDASRVSVDELNKTNSSAKLSTPKQSEREKKKLERLKEKEEREKKKAEEKAEKERLRKEKEEEKRKKEEEKEAEKKKKEEEKKKKEEEKEAEKKRKEEERKKKEEEKEAEKRRKEEEKKRKEEEKENEKKKKEEEERRKKERLSQVFTNFFTQKKTTPAKDDAKRGSNTSLNTTLAFPPFQIKENMKLAPILRTEFDSVRQDILDGILKNPVSSKENRHPYRGSKGRKCGATWPINKDNDVEVIDEDDAPTNREDIVTIVPAVPRRMRAKLLKFCENRRPAYWGTWGKTSQSVGPRRPFGKEVIFDYEIDSDDEWEEEVEPGESLTDSEGEGEGEGEEKEPADDYEVDNEFLVPHGYLSDEEGEKDEDERPLSPSSAKEKLKLKEEQFERELKEKTCHIKPSLIGCCWLDDLNQEPQLLKVLQRYATVVFSSTTPIRLSCSELICESGESPLGDEMARSEKASKRLVNDTDIPALIRVLHGSSYSKLTIIKEFLLYLERNRTEESKNGPSKAQIMAKIADIASWTKCTEAGTMNGRTCWIVNADVLERYNLTDLSAINTWEFATETKKRGRKADDSRTEEDTPPAKTPRVSLLKKFAQPSSGPPRVSTPTETNPTEARKTIAEPAKQTPNSTPKTKKRITLISVPTSATKKPKSDPKSTPLTNFLKKMSTKEALSKASEDADQSLEMDGVEVIPVE